jgi:hypothetical protein
MKKVLLKEPYSMLRTELKVSMIIFHVEWNRMREKDVNYNISKTGLICSLICITTVK